MSTTAERIEAARRRYVAAMGTDLAGLRYDELREAVKAALLERADARMHEIRTKSTT